MSLFRDLWRTPTGVVDEGGEGSGLGGEFCVPNDVRGDT